MFFLNCARMLENVESPLKKYRPLLSFTIAHSMWRKVSFWFPTPTSQERFSIVKPPLKFQPLRTPSNYRPNCPIHTYSIHSQVFFTTQPNIYSRCTCVLLSLNRARMLEECVSSARRKQQTTSFAKSLWRWVFFAPSSFPPPMHSLAHQHHPFPLLAFLMPELSNSLNTLNSSSVAIHNQFSMFSWTFQMLQNKVFDMCRETVTG